mgnify:CR=1 FL=1
MKKILLSLLLITVLMVPTTVMAQDMEINGEQPADSALAENINSNSAVAEVNGEKITQAELKQQANINQLLKRVSRIDQQLVKILAESKAGNNVLKEYQKQQLDSIIDNILLEQKAEEEGISLSSQEKDEIYQKQKQAILDQNKMDEDQFLSVLEKQGYENETEYKNEFLNNPQLKVNKLIEEEIAADIEVSESELKEAYESNKEIFAQGKENVSFEKLKPQLKQMLKQQKKRKKIDNYLSDLRKDAEITKNI